MPHGNTKPDNFSPEAPPLIPFPNQKNQENIRFWACSFKNLVFSWFSWFGNRIGAPPAPVSGARGALQDFALRLRGGASSFLPAHTHKKRGATKPCLYITVTVTIATITVLITTTIDVITSQITVMNTIIINLV